MPVQQKEIAPVVSHRYDKARPC